MAAKDFDTGAIKKQELDDMTTCCICTEVYTDPKVLPCIHTFCMKCIQENGLKTKKGPGDEMPCPMCRGMFKIPPEGFRGLPKNFFIENLIQVSSISDQSASSRAVCDACLDENKEEVGKEIPTADAYCVECKYKLCEECGNEHRKLKFTKNHKLIPITENESGQNVITNPAPSVCQLHEQKVLDVYCADCKTVVCAICFIDDHKNHDGSHANKYVNGFQKQLEDNARAVNECRTKTVTKKAELLRVRDDILKRVEALECDVEKRKDEVKQFADKHANTLLQGLCLIRQSKLKEIQVETDDIDAYLLSLDTYNSYRQKIIAKGSASDICRTFSDLSVRAVELQGQCQPMIDREILSFNFHFIKSELEEFLTESCENLIGEIEEEGDSKPKKREKLKQELDRNKTTNSTLQAKNDKLKQELDAKIMTINSLHVSISRFVQEVNTYRMILGTLEDNVEQLKQELKTTKTDSGSKILNLERKLKQQQSEKEQLMIVQTEEKRHLLDKLRYKSDPILVQTIKTKAADEAKKPTRGLTILGNELFVLSAASSEVEVYDCIELSFNRRWNLEGLISPWDIGSCNINRCLYSHQRFQKPVRSVK